MKIITTILIFFIFVFPLTFSDLRVGFYDSTCSNAETIIHDVVQRRFNQDKSIVAGLLRMHFHDCFVRGCDASILIDPTSTRTSEKNAGPNGSVRGYELIDEAKERLEQECPLTVSCADIIAIATRDGVALAGGIRYMIPTGRKDGLLSDPALVKLPSPSFNVSSALTSFTNKGFTLEEMVTLLGGHTVGFAHCSTFQDRLSSAQGKVDPTMDPQLDKVLVRLCGTNKPKSDEARAFLDQNSSSAFLFDNQFYNQMLLNRGVLNIDQQLALDPMSRDMVRNFGANENDFQEKFAKAMIKLGSVVEGNEEEIRKNCRAFNHPL